MRVFVATYLRLTLLYDIFLVKNEEIITHASRFWAGQNFFISLYA
jgi:hypothetical protein